MKSIAKKRVIKLLVLCCIGLLSFVFTIRVYATRNYSDPDGPRFSGNHAKDHTVQDAVSSEEEVGVVSYNIRYALNMDEAIAELETLAAEQGADIILLQEMDEIGVEQVAQALGLNYVYYPAGIEPVYSHNFGNAILSPWPITDTQKLILPHESLVSGMSRVATKATVTVQGVDILVYSIHAETIMTLPSFRQDQFEAILDDVTSDAQFVIIGGDFNTVTKANTESLTIIHDEAGFTRATTETGHTLTRFRVDAVADHIFSKGFAVVESGKVAEATASDHLPIWAQLKFSD